MKVSVVMASCNPDYDLLKKSIQSVLNQTFKDYELIIVDDGSEKPLEPIIKSIFDDLRIRVYRIDNSGLGAALNYGIGKSTGIYIARLDDDDMMLSERLEKQVLFLEHNADVSCVGTWFYDKHDSKYFPHRKYPTGHNDIVKSLLNFRFSLAHTTLMYTRDAFERIGGYRIKRGGQDLDLILQLGTVGKLANIPEYLTYYNMSASGLGTVNPQKYQAYLFAINDVVNRNLYPEFRKISLSSVEHLKHIDKSPVKSLREKLIRYYLIMRVNIFGKTIG